MKKSYLLLPLLLLSNYSFCQQDLTKVLSQTNIEVLDSLNQVWNQEAHAKKSEATAQAILLGWPVKTILPDGQIIELQSLDELGNPVYYATENANSATSQRTDRVHSGGGAGLNLEGNGMTIGEWDGGATRLTHEQLENRAVQADGAISISNHATHVAGTLIGDGTGSAASAGSAKGMAPQGNLDAYDWNSDDAEMAAAAAAGLLVSNHSYGTIAGWRWDGTGYTWYGGSAQYNSSGEEPGFGNYTSAARNWDIIAFNAPFYLIFKSAGNERSNNPNTSHQVRNGTGGTYETYDPTIHPGGDGIVNGGYDCVGFNGNAKNIMTVAAVNDVLNYTGPGSVGMSSFSSWGPTDDGRIKPDISASGVGLTSSVGSADDAYSSYSGTSMASPSAAGSAILLQEHFENLNGSGSFMRAATLKGLIIHTAAEAGSHPGPDYRFGWGLMNTEAAAEVITEDDTDAEVIQELTLNDGASYTINILSDGTEPLIATLSWTDPAGVAGSSSVVDDPTIRLVNDLDMEMTLGANTFSPYLLDPANPSNAASMGDNNVDNVEKIYLGSPAAGIYKVTISHDGSLTGGSQAYSLIISGGEVGVPGFCFPTYANDCTSGDYIDEVNFSSISNSSSGCNNPGTSNYTFFSSINTALDVSTTYPISVKAGAMQGQYIVAMIDFNLDGDFADAGEFFDLGYATAGNLINEDISIPALVSLGTTTLRIMSRRGNVPILQNEVCGNFDFGEVEDYPIDIKAPACTNLTSPTNGSLNVEVGSDLTWATSTNATGYNLTIGTTSGGTDILNNQDLGNVISYDSTNDFPDNTSIFVKITPYNANGSATCDEESFTTAAAPISTACLPTFSNQCTSGDFIDGIVLHTLSNTGTGCGTPGSNNYTDYTAISTDLERENDYTLTLTAGPDWGQYFIAMIDFNGDDLFSSDEFFDIGYAPAGNSKSGTISVPVDASSGSHLMRIICQYNNNPILFADVCGNFTWGETEDYTIDILVPDCTNLTSPMNNAIDIGLDSELTWAIAVGNPIGYRISVGNSSQGTQFVNNLDLGNVTSYSLPALFPSDENIFVKIIPYNASGDAVGCSEESFSTLPCSVSLGFSNPAEIYSGSYHSIGELTADNTLIENAH